MTVQDVLTWLDGFAPFASQEAFDNAGLVLGNPDSPVSRVYFTLDATLPALREAGEWGAQLVVTHHPLLFGGVKAIRYDTPEGDVLLEAGTIRFKPIVLTAAAAMIGAAVILTDPIFQGLAISLLFGLASSTLLTVLVIPAIYIVLRDDGKPATR